MAQTNEPLLSVKGLKQYFPVSKKFTVRAVDNISFDIYPGETYGLVGESEVESQQQAVLLFDCMIRQKARFFLMVRISARS